MSNPFDAAIRWLNSGISEWTNEERKFWREHPFMPPTDNESHRAAIRVLNAAAAVDERDLGRVFMGFVSTEMRALLEAIKKAKEDHDAR